MEQSIAVQIGPLRLSAALILRIDAVSNGSLAAFFLSASWDGLYEFFGLPLPHPVFYAQLLGAGLLTVALLEWTLAGTVAARGVAFAVAVGSALGAAILLVWLARGDTGADSHGVIVLWSAAGFLALAAAVHAATFIRAGS
jgi:hypothetical protein